MVLGSSFQTKSLYYINIWSQDLWLHFFVMIGSFSRSATTNTMTFSGRYQYSLLSYIGVTGGGEVRRGGGLLMFFTPLIFFHDNIT